MDKNKTIYIGTIENPKITPIKNLLQPNFSGFSKINSGAKFKNICYLDQKYQKQFRCESWEQVERNTYIISRMNAVKNNNFEGEQISITWK